jgi:signal transduction histidine kinase
MGHEPSLSRRLILGAALWIGVALALAGVGLTALFRQHVESALELTLENALDGLAAAVEPDGAGRPALARPLPDPLYDRPYSGHYWQVEAGGTRLRSRSLWDAVLALPDDDLPVGALHRHRLAGPAGQGLIVVERQVTVAGVPGTIRIAAAASDAELAPAIAGFARMLGLSLGVLGAGLIAAAVLQVRYGLRPLARLRAALAALRAGRAARIAGTWPVEVAALAADLDALVAHDAAVVARARAQASDLAHALKTRLAILANAAGARDDPLAQTVRTEAAAMLRQVERHLARARAASSAGLPGVRADAVAVARDLARTLARLQHERALAIDVGGGPAWFAGDREDLTELLGTVLDNACKWARTRVRVALAVEGAVLTVAVDDDGPGLPPDRREAVFARGARLDETREGSGLGLAIARELAELYGGSVALEDSALGGLRAVLRLPAASPAA